MWHTLYSSTLVCRSVHRCHQALHLTRSLQHQCVAGNHHRASKPSKSLPGTSHMRAVDTWRALQSSGNLLGQSAPLVTRTRPAVHLNNKQPCRDCATLRDPAPCVLHSINRHTGSWGCFRPARRTRWVAGNSCCCAALQLCKQRRRFDEAAPTRKALQAARQVGPNRVCWHVKRRGSVS